MASALAIPIVAEGAKAGLQIGERLAQTPVIGFQEVRTTTDRKGRRTTTKKTSIEVRAWEIGVVAAGAGILIASEQFVQAFGASSQTFTLAGLAHSIFKAMNPLLP